MLTNAMPLVYGVTEDTETCSTTRFYRSQFEFLNGSLGKSVGEHLSEDLKSDINWHKIRYPIMESTYSADLIEECLNDRTK